MAKALLEMSLLYDLYGGMLTEKQREIFEMYYNDDLSLSEISENQGITRQGVRDAVLRTEETLRDCEVRLGLMNKLGRLSQDAGRIQQLAAHILELNRKNYFDARIQQDAEEIQSLAGSMGY